MSIGKKLPTKLERELEYKAKLNNHIKNNP